MVDQKATSTVTDGFYDRWWRERRDDPSWMMVHVDDPLKEGSQIDAYVHPSIDRRDAMWRFREPRYRKGYEIGFCVILELVTSRQASRMNTALSVIKCLHGLDSREALAFLVQHFILVVDFARHRCGEESLLRGRTSGEVASCTSEERAEIVAEENRPLYRLEQLLEFWDMFGGALAKLHPLKSTDGSPGRPSYLSIPPAWLSIERLKNIGEGSPQLRKIPVFVDPSVARLTEKFAEFYGEHDNTIGPPNISFLAQSGGVGSAEDVPGHFGPGTHQPSSRLGVTLSDAEEHEFEANRFNSRILIQVTGQTEVRKTNVILFDGREVTLPDAQFRLFLRLVAALHEADDGYVSLGTLRSGGGITDEGIAFPEEIYQAVSRLRFPLRTALHPLKPVEFIQVSRKRIRLSTHKRYVLFNRDQLARHPDELIRSLALRLPSVSG